MEKRVLLALILSMLIIITWSVLVPRPTPLPPLPLRQPAHTEIVNISKPIAQQLVTLSTTQYEINFIESQAAIQDIVFKAYQSYRYNLQYGFSLDDPNLIFHREKGPADEMVFSADDGRRQIIKRFIFHNSNYNIELEIDILNKSGNPMKMNTPLILGLVDFTGNQTRVRLQDATIALKEKILHPNVHKDVTYAETRFLAIRDQYFCAIVEFPKETFSAHIKKINAQKSVVGLTLPEIILEPGQQIIHKFNIYVGPQDAQLIAQGKPEWVAVMYYGVFDIISQVLLQVVEFLYRLVRNWGLAIILLSTFIYFLLFPLSLKQMRSMKEMQSLQPRLEALRTTYKDNPQKLNKEIIALYKAHNINPLGGCFPMLLQIPIFFALYQVLIRSIHLKGATFLWIKDLSESDQAFTIPVSLPMLGNGVNILPILMVIIMFIQQKITSVTTTGASSEQQKFMLIFMPIMFLFIFYNMPAGLVLYWLVNSALMLFHQFRINRTK